MGIAFGEKGFETKGRKNGGKGFLKMRNGRVRANSKKRRRKGKGRREKGRATKSEFQSGGPGPGLFFEINPQKLASLPLPPLPLSSTPSVTATSVILELICEFTFLGK